MDYLNDELFEIYIETLKKQSVYIDKRLDTIRNRILTSDIIFQGNSKDAIASFLNIGTAQNLILAFFKQPVTECLHCKKKRSEVRQLERAHCNKDRLCRRDLLMRALDKIFVNMETPIHSRDILIQFIKEHKNCPIYFLCTACHKFYDHS